MRVRNARLTFAEWMAAVDADLRVLVGTDSRDLPDCPYHDWYEDDVSVASAVRMAIKNAVE